VMALKQSMRALSNRVLPLLVMLLWGFPYANAAEPVSIDNLQAAVQTLKFLDSLPKDGPIAIGVIYAPEVSNAQLLATETSKALSAMRGPNNRDIQTVVMTTDEVSHYAGHLDVVYLLVGVSNHSNIIVPPARGQHLRRSRLHGGRMLRAPGALRTTGRDHAQ
jgi:hypothetical protein